MYSSLQDFEPIIKSNIFSVHEQNKLISKSNRSALMSYLQGSNKLSVDIIAENVREYNQKTDNFGNTKLMYLCAFNKNLINFKIIKFLNTDIGCQNNKGVTALMYLCSESYFNLSSLTVFNVEMRKHDIYGMTALMYYSRTIHPTRKVLFQLSQELELRDNLGQTALMHYCSTFKKDLRSTYLENVATIFRNEIGKACNAGRTALMRYVLNEEVSIDVIKMLSVEIGMRDNYGNTALMLYLFNSTNPRISIIEALKNEIVIKNYNDISPLKIAENKYLFSNQYQYKDVIDFIDRYMAIERMKQNKPFPSIQKHEMIVQKKIRPIIPIEIKPNRLFNKNEYDISNHILRSGRHIGIIKNYRTY